jgi:hypothetical protein
VVWSHKRNHLDTFQCHGVEGWVRDDITVHKDPIYIHQTIDSNGMTDRQTDRQSECGTLQSTKLSIVFPALVTAIPLVIVTSLLVFCFWYMSLCVGLLDCHAQ